MGRGRELGHLLMDLAKEMLPAPAPLSLSWQGACSGVLRGIGKQKFGAILNAVSYYGVGMPLAAVLLFVAKIGVMGTDPWALHPQTPHGQVQGLPTTLVPGSVPPLTCLSTQGWTGMAPAAAGSL